ncbi:MAG TPA: 50S ribosomal protein L25 [Anaerolineales bacterium]|nr:50S ribosomal protein L25 [Anaerolineales bacterium]
MEEIVLKASQRTVIGKQVKAIRREGKLPAVIYGHRLHPVSIVMDLRETTKSLMGLAPSALVIVDIDGTQHKALVREKQRNKLTGTLLHVDFLAVSMTEKLRSQVYIEIIGVAPAIKDFDGVLVTGPDEVEVECLPQDLPERITADISGLAKIGDGIYVRDLVVPEGVKILEEPETMVALITAQAAVEEEVVPVPVEEGAVEEPEVIEHGKKEEEGEEEDEEKAKGKEKE